MQLPFDEDDSNTLIIPVVPLEDDELPEADDLPTTSGSTYKSKQEPFSGKLPILFVYLTIYLFLQL